MNKPMLENMNPMLASETFMVNLYGNPDQINHFNFLLSDYSENYLKIREFVEKIISSL